MYFFPCKQSCAVNNEGEPERMMTLRRPEGVGYKSAILSFYFLETVCILKILNKTPDNIFYPFLHALNDFSALINGKYTFSM